LVKPVDDAPVVNKSLDDVVINEDAEEFEIDLSTLFTDIDNEDAQISISLKEISKSDLLVVKLKDKQLQLAVAPNAHGEAEIILTGTSNGKSVETSFKVIVNSVDDKLVITNSIKNVKVLEDADEVQINLKDVFSDIDNLNGTIVKTVLSQRNSELVSCEITEDDLTLSFVANAFGEDEITIQGAIDGHTASTSFKVVVEPVDDAPIVANEIGNVVAEMNAADGRIDLGSVFNDIDNEVFSYNITVSNEQLISTSLEGETLILQYQMDQYGESAVTVKATANGKSVESSFNVKVNKPLYGPELLKAIKDLLVSAGSDDIVIDLSEVFACEDGDMAFSVVENSNNQLVETQISDEELLLSFISDEFGKAVLTIQAEANGKAVETSFTLTVDPTTGIKELEKEDVTIYPNPCKDYFWLEMGSYNGDVQVSILNITGRVVKSKQVRNITRERFDMTSLPTGMYLIQLHTSEGVQVKKILKK